MQPSHTSLGTDLTSVARGFGIADAFDIPDRERVGELTRRIKTRSAPTFARVRIGLDEPPRTLPPRDGAFVKNRFRGALGLRTF